MPVRAFVMLSLSLLALACGSTAGNADAADAAGASDVPGASSPDGADTPSDGDAAAQPGPARSCSLCMNGLCYDPGP
jgi:hypothetical protein